MEAVSNRAREPDDPDGFYQRILTACWKEAFRILKPGGLLAFTFHHSEDAPWVSVLESLFDAGFFLEATYPIRSDETKGEGEFGSKTIEYDIIHVCRKRTEEPQPVSWGRMRREVLADVRQLQGMLENHARAGLPAADLQVIRRGKALEYFSRHYGKVYVDECRPISVKDALVGINQLIDEDTNKLAEPPPVTAEPVTRQFLRIFDGKT
jgi:putative DNA methylase